MVRLKDIELNKSLDCVKSLIKGNIPLCVVDFKEVNSMDLLKEIAFKADLFIAVENISTLDNAFLAAGNGAQFFILENCNESLMKSLQSSGFYFIPKVHSSEDMDLCSSMNLECIICDNSDLYRKYPDIHLVQDDNSLGDNTLFSIINIPNNNMDYEKWINNVVRNMIGFDYTEVLLSENATVEDVFFAETFAATHKCLLSEGFENTLVLECGRMDLALNYFKWRNIFIDPNESEVLNNKIVKGPLDKKLSGFNILLKEKETL